MLDCNVRHGESLFQYNLIFSAHENKQTLHTDKSNKFDILGKSIHASRHLGGLAGGFWAYESFSPFREVGWVGRLEQQKPYYAKYDTACTPKTKLSRIIKTPNTFDILVQRWIPDSDDC